MSNLINFELNDKSHPMYEMTLQLIDSIVNDHGSWKDNKNTFGSKNIEIWKQNPRNVWKQNTFNRSKTGLVQDVFNAEQAQALAKAMDYWGIQETSLMQQKIIEEHSPKEIKKKKSLWQRLFGGYTS